MENVWFCLIGITIAGLFFSWIADTSYRNHYYGNSALDFVSAIGFCIFSIMALFAHYEYTDSYGANGTAFLFFIVCAGLTIFFYIFGLVRCVKTMSIHGASGGYRIIMFLVQAVLPLLYVSLAILFLLLCCASSGDRRDRDRW